MTNKECIEILKTIELRLDLDVIEDGADAINMGIQALEKQEPKKPIRSIDEYGRVYECPVCGEHYLEVYCPTCGQAIDWSE
jgi:rubrerythrin